MSISSACKLIIITGPDGAGKSSVIAQIQSALSNKCFAFCSIWDGLQSLKGLQKEDIQNYLVELSPQSRTLFLAHALFESYHKALIKNPEYIIFDSYWYKYAVTEMLMKSENCLDIFSLLPVPDKVFFLECSALATLQRKLANGGLSLYESTFLQDAQAEMKIQALWKTIEETNGPTWKHLSETLSVHEKSQVILKSMKGSYEQVTSL